jgi:class 3 adenylate cyclase
MTRLTASERAKLPNRAFAYVDSKGRRRLPIHDEAHVRNALSRFERVSFEDDAARERARKRLLTAAKKYGMVPVGFMASQLRLERGHNVSDLSSLPTGSVTFLMTDIEGSTALLQRLGERYSTLLTDVRRVIRRSVQNSGGHEVDARADEYFAVFKKSTGAVSAALATQRRLRERAWSEGVSVRVRAGIHGGRPTLTDAGYVGLTVHTVARVCAAAHGGQILVSSRTKAAVSDSLPPGVRLRSRGRFDLQGISDDETLFEVEEERPRPRQR